MSGVIEQSLNEFSGMVSAGISRFFTENSVEFDKSAVDAGIEITKIGILNFSQDEGFRTRLSLPLPVEEK